MNTKTIRIHVEKPDHHLIDCHMVINDIRHKTLRLKKSEFVHFLERLFHEVYNKGSEIHELILPLH